MKVLLQKLNNALFFRKVYTNFFCKKPDFKQLALGCQIA